MPRLFNQQDRGGRPKGFSQEARRPKPLRRQRQQQAQQAQRAFKEQGRQRQQQQQRQRQQQQQQQRKQGQQQQQELGGALQQRMMQDVTGTPGQDDPITAALRAKFETETQSSREAQIERLNRLGLLRGGGDTADVLGKFEGQVELGRMQLGADQARRQQEGVQQAIGFQENRGSLEEQRRSRQQEESQFGRKLGLSAQQQALEAELGRGELGVREQEIGLRGELGRGELGLSEQELALREELGRGELGLSGQETALRQELGRGGLQEQIASRELQGELGRGRLGLEAELGRAS